MKRKTTISLIIALLMILSTLVIATPSSASDQNPIFCVEKLVSNGEGWYDSVHAICGDTVQFKITIAYYGEHCVENILVTDTLPPCFEYVETVEPEDIEPIINGNVLFWDLDETYLNPYCSTNIIFKAKVIGIGEHVNTVNVTAIECCPSHSVYAEDTATVIVDSSVDVQKTAWDPETKAWVDELGWVIKGKNVRFRIVITYHGADLMKCMVVEDYLGECEYGCLYYAGNIKITYPSANFDAPEITVSESLKYIKFDWTKSRFNLNNGESIVIEFDTEVTNYCECVVTNYAFIDIWGCECCTHIYGSDYATVHCTPHEPIFNKKIYDGKEYVEKADVYVNDTIKYKIDLTYYGTYNLTEIKIMDELPCVLEHIDEDAVLAVSHNTRGEYGIGYIAIAVSENKKTAWWNITDELEDGDSLSIVFNVLVTGATGDCEECGINTASYTASSYDKDYSGSDTAKIYSTYRPPAPPTKISIKLRRMSIGRVCGTISNIGDADLTNVKCDISVNGGIRKKINLKINETFEQIKSGSSASICTGKRSIKRAFGKITVQVTISIGDETFEKNFKGFVIGRLIIVRQPMIQPMS